jgi:hypothetical protein
MSQRFVPTPEEAPLARGARGWVFVSGVIAAELAGLMLSFLGPAWLVTQYQLLALVREGNARALQAGLVSASEVSQAGEALFQVFRLLAPWVVIGFLACILIARLLEYWHVRLTAIRVVSALLCATVVTATIVFSVIGFYQSATLGGLAAGAGRAAVFGGLIVPANVHRSPK